MNRDRALVTTAEVGLACVTLAAVLGMNRLFAGGGWLGPLAVNAVAAHVVVAAARRRGASLPATAAIMAVAALAVITWTSYAHTSAFGVPTGRTFSAMRIDLDRAWSLYQDVVAPAPVETGFVLASALAVWGVAFVADWAAFRLWVPFEATLPAGTLFLFTALLGDERGRTWAVGLFAAAVVWFLLVHRTAREDAGSHWVADRRRPGHRSLLAVGTGLGVLAVVAGTVLGPVMPGARSPGWVDPRSLHGGDGSRVTISPLVDIRARLVNQSRLEVFQVRSPQPAYWRLTSLDRFDGQIWSSSGSYEKATGTLPEAVVTKVPTATFDQTFTIESLAAIWLPSAYEPRAIDTAGLDVLYEDESATLIVDRDADTSDGLTYQVTSASPRITAADLAGASGEVPADIAARYLDLPDGFSPRVRELAQQLTARSTSPYQAARALQDHLRTFTYDLDVRSGHGANALESFLFDTRRGYCEQFAGAFASMARAIGLPARVAVGFTQGATDPLDPTLFRVRGEHAHAWPEVFLAGAGWVSFEPTPGRGQPFAEAYTGVSVAQATTDDPGTATTAPPTTSGPVATIPDASSDPRVRDELDTQGGPTGSIGSRDPSIATRFVTRPIRRAAPVVGIAVGAYLVLVPLGRLLSRHLRRRRAVTPAARIALAWTEVTEDAALLGYREVDSDTFRERARRLTSVLPDPDSAVLVSVLTGHHERAVYAAEAADDLVADEAEQAGSDLARSVRAAAPRRARIRRWCDPRPWTRGWRRRLLRQRRITTTVRADLEVERELVGSGDRR